MSDITPKQQKLLQSIYDWSVSNGSSPTLQELTAASGKNHTRTVVEMLDHLEEAGLINRLAGTARGLSLTKKAHHVLQIPPEATTWPEKRQFILKRLGDFSPTLRDCYFGGIKILEDTRNPRRLQLSAYSMRDIITWMQYVEGDEPKKVAEDKKKRLEEKAGGKRKSIEEFSVRAETLKWTIDPQGGFEIASELNKAHAAFSNIGHGGSQPTESTYLKQLSAFEDLLANCILIEQRDAIELLSKEINCGPEKADYDQIRMLIRRNFVSKKYFFDQVGADWLDSLLKNDLLRRDILVAQYLLKCAKEKPDEVMSFILSVTKAQVEDVRVFYLLADATLQMPARTAKKIVKKIKNDQWLAPNLGATLLEDSSIKLLEFLIKESEYQAASELTELLFSFRTVERGSYARKESVINEHYLLEAKKLIDSIPPLETEVFLNSTLSCLKQLVRGEDGGDDDSWFWCRSIENPGAGSGLYEGQHCLVETIRDLGCKYFDELAKDGNTSKMNAALDKFFPVDSKMHTVKRLRMYLCDRYFREFEEAAIGLVVQEINSVFFDREYSDFLVRHFDEFTDSEKNFYLTKVFEAEEDADWKARRLLPIKDSLGENDKKKFDAFCNEIGFEPTRNNEPLIRSGWGPKPFLSEKEMAELSVEEVILKCKLWKQSDDWETATYVGTARAVEKDVCERPKEWTKVLSSLSKDTIHPQIIGGIFRGLQLALKEKKIFDWVQIMPLMEWIVDGFQQNSLPAFEQDRDFPYGDTPWNSTFESMSDLLEIGLNTSSIPQKYSGNVLKCIGGLCKNSDPTPEYEAKNADNKWGFYHLSINTIRGRAFHSLFAYLRWLNRSLKKKGTTFPAEVKNIIESALEPEKEPTGTIRCVIGSHVPQLFYTEKDWTIEKLPAIFPEKVRPLFAAALEGLLHNTLYLEMIPHLSKIYLQSTKDNLGRNKSMLTEEMTEVLIDHIGLMYFLGINEEVFEEFLKVATFQQKAKLVSFIGRSLISKDSADDKKRLHYDRIKSFWGKCIDDGNSDVLIEFGYWLEPSIFTISELLDMVEATLKTTKGQIRRNDNLLKLLAENVKEHADKCGNILYLMIHAEASYIHSYHCIFLSHEVDLVKSIMMESIRTRDPANISMVKAMVDRLMKFGFRGYEDLLKDIDKIATEDLKQNEDI